jgi:hypothetical protein
MNQESISQTFFPWCSGAHFYFLKIKQLTDIEKNTVTAMLSAGVHHLPVGLNKGIIANQWYHFAGSK